MPGATAVNATGQPPHVMVSCSNLLQEKKANVDLSPGAGRDRSAGEGGRGVGQNLILISINNFFNKVT